MSLVHADPDPRQAAAREGRRPWLIGTPMHVIMLGAVVLWLVLARDMSGPRAVILYVLSALTVLAVVGGRAIWSRSTTNRAHATVRLEADPGIVAGWAAETLSEVSRHGDVHVDSERRLLTARWAARSWHSVITDRLVGEQGFQLQVHLDTDGSGTRAGVSSQLITRALTDGEVNETNVRTIVAFLEQQSRSQAEPPRQP